MSVRRAPPGALLALVLALAACGATPSQAPLSQAKKLDSATSGISTACGESYQLTAFPGDHRSDLITLVVTASSKARQLASVDKLDPAWIYQGETIRQIVNDSVSMLRSCGLEQAATVLTQATAKR